MRKKNKNLEVRLYRVLERALNESGILICVPLLLMEKSLNPLGLSLPRSKMRRLPSYIHDSIWDKKFRKVIQDINIGVINRTLTFVLIIFKEKKLTRADP